MAVVLALRICRSISRRTCTGARGLLAGRPGAVGCVRDLRQAHREQRYQEIKALFQSERRAIRRAKALTVAAVVAAFGLMWVEIHSISRER
jgi:hypothetical protein